MVSVCILNYNYLLKYWWSWNSNCYDKSRVWQSNRSRKSIFVQAVDTPGLIIVSTYPIEVYSIGARLLGFLSQAAIL